MPIPDLNEHGLLPVGLHDCTFAELKEKFGQNRWVPDQEAIGRREVLCPQRARLCDQLERYLVGLRRAGFDVEVLVDGSFVTEKPDPNDIDLIVVFPAEHDFARALPPQEYALVAKRRLRDEGYPFDIFVGARGDPVYEMALRLFQRVRDRDDLTKALEGKAMIKTDTGLRVSLDLLVQAYTTLAGLRAAHPNASADWLAVMAEGVLDHARQLQQEIEAYTGATAFAEAQADLWLTVTGRGIREGEGPASILTALLDAFRKGVQSVAEFLAAGQLARRPAAALKDACDWRVVALRPGSLKIGIRLPTSPAQPGLWEDGAGPDVRRAVREFLEVAGWAASSDAPEALATRFPDPDKRRLLLNAVKPFVPRPRGSVESVTVSGRQAPSAAPIALTRAASQWIDLAIDQTTTERVEDHTGDLREIDLDNLTMTIRNAGDVREVRCTLDESLLEAAKEALDRRVKVSGVRQSRIGGRALASLHVFRLEVLDEVGAENEPGAEGRATVAG